MNGLSNLNQNKVPIVLHSDLKNLVSGRGNLVFGIFRMENGKYLLQNFHPKCKNLELLGCYFVLAHLHV